MPAVDFQTQAENRRMSVLVKSAVKPHLAGYRIRKIQFVSTQRDSGSPHSVAKRQRDAVFRVSCVLRKRQSRRITGNKCGDILVHESSQASTIAVVRNTRRAGLVDDKSDEQNGNDAYREKSAKHFR